MADMARRLRGCNPTPGENVYDGSMLHSAVRDHVEDLRRRFSEAQPFRHVIIEPLLEPEFCKQLAAEFPAFDPRYARNELGEAGRKAVVPEVARIGPGYARFDGLMRDLDFLQLMGRVTDIPGLLYDRDYAGGGTHENLDGQELDPHVDFNYHPTRAWHRRLNLILFLNEEWEPGWGGCLELLHDPWSSGEGARIEVVPLMNRAVVFETTESSWHGFPRIRLPAGKQVSRRSVAVYFYTRQRPSGQTSPAHGTIYYQRQLPEHIQAGCTLSEEDVTEVRTLLARRDKTIQFLYERELKFAGVMERILQSPSFRLGRALTWPMRLARTMIKHR